MAETKVTAYTERAKIRKNRERRRMLLFQSKAVAGAMLGMSLLTNAVLFPKFATVDDIPAEYFAQNKVIFGKVERVIDGDTIRIRHCPTRFNCPKGDPTVRRIYDSTLSIRIYGVDCPELQKRKSDPPSQPFAEEAKDFTSNLILDKKVKIKLLRKDRYGRALGKVETTLQKFPPLTRKDVSLELIQRGLATLYTGGGAEYDGNRELMEKKQKKAERRKRGVWSQGGKMVTPAEFKRQQKQLKAATAK